MLDRFRHLPLRDPLWSLEDQRLAPLPAELLSCTGAKKLWSLLSSWEACRDIDKVKRRRCLKFNPSIEDDRGLTLSIFEIAERSGGIESEFETPYDRYSWERCTWIKLRNPQVLYELLGREDIIDKRQKIIDQISRISNSSNDHRLQGDGYFIELRNAWECGKSWHGLQPFKKPEFVGRMLLILKAVEIFRTYISARKLGTLLFNDSKVILRERHQIVAVFRSLYDVPQEEDPYETLARFGIIREGAEIIISGPIAIPPSMPEFTPCDHHLYTSIPASSIDHLVIGDQIRQVLTVENKESFVEYCSRHMVGCDDTLVIFTSGFPSLTLQALIRKLSKQGMDIHHWGDIDPGGVAIARIIEECAHYGNFYLFEMALSLAEKYGTNEHKTGGVLNNQTQKVGPNSQLWELADYFDNYDGAKTLEQEAITPPKLIPYDKKEVA